MLTCPKCNFEQPDDRYCANCGIDMESFASQEPLQRKMFKGTPAVHASIVLAVIITTLSLVLSQNKMSFLSEDHLKRVSYSRSELITSSTGTKKETADSPSPSKTASLSTAYKTSPQKQEASAFGLSLKKNTKIQNSAKEKSSTTTLKNPKTSSEKPIRLVAHYFIFPTENWSQFEDQLLQLQNTYGVLRSAKDVLLQLKKNPTHFILSASPSMQNTLPPSQRGDLNLIYDQLIGENNGIWLRVKATKTRDGHAQIHFSLQSRFEMNSSGEAALSVPIENTVTVPSGSAIYFMKPLPQVSLPENSPLLIHPIYRFFESPEYLEGISDIQILLELNKF